jgi:hypothetical protein
MAARHDEKPVKVLCCEKQFFLINLSHESLANYYKMNFSLLQFHKYSLDEIEGMIPFEREVYVALLIQHLEEEKQKLKSNQ